MSATPVLYTNPMSRGRIVRWLLEEIGCPYDVEVVSYGPAMKSPDFLALNPMGKVPVLRHGAAVICETAAICAYLTDAYPDAGLAPAAGTPARGDYLRWLFFAAGPVEAALGNQMLGVVVPEDKRGMVGYGCFDDTMAVLEQAVSATPYLAGEAFSAADVYVASHLNWGMMFGVLPTRPAFEAYVARMTARPAAERAKALDDALMPPPAG